MEFRDLNLDCRFLKFMVLIYNLDLGVGSNFFLNVIFSYLVVLIDWKGFYLGLKNK